MNNESLKYLLALHRGLNLTFARGNKLANFFAKNWEKAYKASLSEFMQAGIDKQGIEKWFAIRENISPEREFELIKKCNAKILLSYENNFPQNLLHISNPPFLLFVLGEILETDFPSISVVGSRKFSSYGRLATEKVIGEIASQGVTIVSGLALGIDFLAHKAAIENGSRTIAVLGSGIDNITPRTNYFFAKKFLENKKGAIISEYLPETESRPEFFPLRNRIVSGLSKAVIIVEAAESSGSLITAELAIEQNKEVFAIPGEIFNKSSLGTNNLIAKGQAQIAISAAQILANLGFTNIAVKNLAKKTIATTKVENEILQIFKQQQKIHIDDIVRFSELPANVVTSTLAILELKGLISHLGKQVYMGNL